MAERLELKVNFEDPVSLSVPTLFSNHVAISRAGTEVQFEFVAVDLNVLATKVQRHANEGEEGPIEITGKTMAKIVVPLHVFLQLESHVLGMFQAIHKEFAKIGEGVNEHSSTVS